MKTFTKQQIADWNAYEEVRQGGKWNMYWPQARIESGLSESRYSFVMDNYEALQQASIKEIV